MFGKLLKYEFKSISKWYLGLLFITSLVAITAGNLFKEMWKSIDASSAYSVGYNIGRFSSQEINFMMAMIILTGLVIAITVASYIIIIRRFYSSIFSRQGYLTMTLPVSTHAVILSKLLVGFLLFAITYVIFIVIGSSFIVPTIGWEGVKEIFKTFYSTFVPVNRPFGIFLWHLDLILSTILGVLFMYLSMSIGQLFNNYRILMGFVSYGVLITIQSLITLLMTSTFTDTGLLTAEILMSVLFIAISYVATHAIIKYKLNLE